MTASEIKLATQIFTILPTLTIAIALAVMYVKHQNSTRNRENRLIEIEEDIKTNSNNIIRVVKIHLDRHPEDANNFMKNEFIEK